MMPSMSSWKMHPPSTSMNLKPFGAQVFLVLFSIAFISNMVTCSGALSAAAAPAKATCYFVHKAPVSTLQCYDAIESKPEMSSRVEVKESSSLSALITKARSQGYHIDYCNQYNEECSCLRQTPKAYGCLRSPAASLIVSSGESKHQIEG